MGWATRKWQLRRCIKPMECRDAPAERPRRRCFVPEDWRRSCGNPRLPILPPEPADFAQVRNQTLFWRRESRANSSPFGEVSLVSWENTGNLFQFAFRGQPTRSNLGAKSVC